MLRDAAPVTDAPQRQIGRPGQARGPLARERFVSRALMLASLGSTMVFSIALDVSLPSTDLLIVIPTLEINLTAVMFSAVGLIVEARRRGHRVGRLMMLAGPLYAMLALGWNDSARPLLDPETYRVVNWAGIQLSWAGVALIAGWLPLLFPTGSLPGPQWRVPAVLIAGFGTACLIANALRPGPLVEGIDITNPFGLEQWPPVLQRLADSVLLAIVALVSLALAGLWTRYRRGDPVERLQIRWLMFGLAVLVTGAAGVLLESLIRREDGTSISAQVVSLGLMLIPVAAGIAILRYRLYDIDRLISRTLSWAIVTGLVAVVFVVLTVSVQALLAGVTQGATLAVAASTLAACLLFQPLRRRVQALVDQRFDRRKVSAERTTEALAARLRHDVDLDSIAGELRSAVAGSLAPSRLAVWIRGDHS
jgi:hypothetical protein